MAMNGMRRLYKMFTWLVVAVRCKNKVLLPELSEMPLFWNALARPWRRIPSVGVG